MYRRHFLGAAIVVGSLAVAKESALAQPVGGAKSLPDRSALNSLGEEGEALALRTGLWDVRETLWRAPGAPTETSAGLVAERFMMGSVLQEIIRPVDDITRKEVKRTDLTTFDRVEGRWQYVSFDTRDPVGLMPAWSSNAGDGKKFSLEFFPIAAWNDGGTGGTLLRLRQETYLEDLNTDRKDQYFTLADGQGLEWLGHRYEYKRRG